MPDTFLSSLQITPIGIGIAVLVFFCLMGFVNGIKPTILRGPGRRKVWVAVALGAALLCWGDEFWIAWHFSQACKDAGVHVSRKVEVEGFYDDTGRGTSDAGLIRNPQWIDVLEKSSFRFYERRLLNGKVAHVEKVNGQWQQINLDRPMARYHYKFTDPSQEILSGLKLKKGETLVIDMQTGLTIGRETWFNRYPGWIEGLWIRFLGSGMTQCPDPGKGPRREHLPEAVLSSPMNK